MEERRERDRERTEQRGLDDRLDNHSGECGVSQNALN